MSSSAQSKKEKLVMKIIGFERKRMQFYVKNRVFTKEELRKRYDILMDKTMEDLYDIYDSLLYWFDKYVIFPMSLYYSGEDEDSD